MPGASNARLMKPSDIEIHHAVVEGNGLPNRVQDREQQWKGVSCGYDLSFSWVLQR